MRSVTMISVPYVLAQGGYKSSLLLLYIRLFSVKPLYRYLCWITIFCTAGFSISNVFTQLLGCHPLSKFWNPDTPGECINYYAANVAFNTLVVLTDLLVAILPFPIVWRLQMSRHEKVAVSLIFLSGAMWVKSRELKPWSFLTDNYLRALIFSILKFIVGLVDQSGYYDRFGLASVTFLLGYVEPISTFQLEKCLTQYLVCLRSTLALSAPARPRSGPY